MAKIKCRECGADISDKAESCPRCGCPTSAAKRYPQFYSNKQDSSAVEYGRKYDAPSKYNSQSNAVSTIDKKYCKHCGQLIDKDCIICPKCGKQVEELSAPERNIVINNTNNSSASSTATAAVINGAGMISPKSRLMTLLLCLFLGVLAIHRFYVGKIISGIIMILLMFTGIGEVWLLIDFIFILFGWFKDSYGRRILVW